MRWIDRHVNHDRPTLDYAAPRKDGPPAGMLVAEGVSVGIGTLVLFAIYGILTSIAADATRDGDRDAGYGATAVLIALVATGVVLLAIFAWIARSTFRDPRCRGVSIGIWVALAIIAMVALAVIEMPGL